MISKQLQMERLSANYFFGDCIVRAGSPEAAAASPLLAELCQVSEAHLSGQRDRAQRRLFAVASQPPSHHPDWSH